MEFPFNPLLLRRPSLIPDKDEDDGALEKNILKTEIPKGKFILVECMALENVILSQFNSAVNPNRREKRKRKAET